MNLFKIGLVTLGLLTLSVLGVSAQESGVRGNTLQEVVDSTYKMNMNGLLFGIPARMPICSAVAVSPTQLVTAAHCVNTDVDMSIVVENLNDTFDIISEEVVRVSPVRVNRDDDTAFLEILDNNKSFNTWVIIAEDVNLEMGDILSAVGYPRVADITLTEGLYTGLVPLPSEYMKKGKKSLFYKATTPVTGGSSGGGFYQRTFDLTENKFKYELIGLTTAGFRDVDFQNYFSTHESLMKVIKNLLDLPGSESSISEDVDMKTNHLEAWKELQR